MERAVRPWKGLPREVWSHPSGDTSAVVSICFRGKGMAGMGERRKSALPAKEGDSEGIWDGAKAGKEAAGSDPKG